MVKRFILEVDAFHFKEADDFPISSYEMKMNWNQFIRINYGLQVKPGVGGKVFQTMHLQFVMRAANMSIYLVLSYISSWMGQYTLAQVYLFLL
jgi:hypothetical protein